MNSKRAIAQLLQQLAGLGVTHLPKVTLPRTAPLAGRSAGAATGQRPGAPAGPGVVPAAGRAGSPARSGRDRPISVPTELTHAAAQRPYNALHPPAALESESVVTPDLHPLTASLLSDSFATTTEKAESLCQLAGVVAGCTRCQELASTRKQTVFGVGNPNARIMFIGEAPGADEDAQGEPFVGRAGQLLNKIIESSQLRREDLYICNILRCRPPGNRNPLPQEAANCREYLDAQIHIVRPEYIICWGTVAAQNLLNEKRAVGKLRGQFLDYKGAKVLCTYHPSYLLRYPSAKVQVWEDMKFFMKELGVTLQ